MLTGGPEGSGTPLELELEEELLAEELFEDELLDEELDDDALLELLELELLLLELLEPSPLLPQAANAAARTKAILALLRLATCDL